MSHQHHDPLLRCLLAVLRWSLPERDRESILDDLREELATRAATEPPALTRRWLARDLLRSHPHNLHRRLRRDPLQDPSRRGDRLVTTILSDLRYAMRQCQAR